MHFCTAAIAIGGDTRNTMVRDRFNPISWPEIEILRLLHGDEAITEVVPFVRVNQEGRNERARLTMIYGEGPAQQCWGGRNAPSEMDCHEVKLANDDAAWFNPLAGKIEGELKAPPPPLFGKAETVGDMTKPAPKPEPEFEDEDDETNSDELVSLEPMPAKAAAEPVKRPVRKAPVRRKAPVKKRK